MPDNFQVGDLVWAKMQGFSAWPGRVTTLKPFLGTPPSRPSQCIFFFGTRDFNYVENANIKPYYDFKSKFSKSCQSAQFLKALEDIEDFIQKKETDPNYDPEETVNASEESEKEEEEVVMPKERKRGRGSVKSGVEAKMSKTENAASPNKNGSQSSDGEKNSSITKTNLETSTNSNSEKDIEKPVIGVLGIGQLGRIVVTGLAKNHKVNIWNRTQEKAEKLKVELEEQFPGRVEVFDRASDVLSNSDILFSCVTDSTAVKNIAYGIHGLFHGLDKMDNKGYVELSNVGIEASIEMSKLIKERGGRYLEAQLQRCSSVSGDEKFVILTAGHDKLYEECKSAFSAIGRTIFFMGNVGSACKMNLIMQVIKGVSMIGLTESFALARKCSLKLEDIEEIFNITSMNSPFLQQISSEVVKGGSTLDEAIVHLHNDIKNALDFSDVLNQPLLMTASVRESIIRHLSSS